MQKNLFLFFHINILYSSIKIKDRTKVIKKCYWPILEVAEKKDIHLGIEISGHCLEVINQLDKQWINKFKFLIKKKKISLIGSGYCQIIGPLVPYKLNMYNYKIGNEVVKRILNTKAKTALINEHCFSKSLIDILKKNSFKTMIMEWENSKINNGHLSERLKYQTNLAGDSKDKIKIIWNSSLNFQNFQKFVYGNLTDKSYLSFLKKNKIKQNEFIVLYGSDAEVFNFRPRKTSHNYKANYSNEWKKISQFLENLKTQYKFLSLEDLQKKNFLSKKLIKELTNAETPCTTKKQGKYNITRWALTGNNDYKINTECFKIFKSLEKNKVKDFANWKKLCLLWSSDFRTYIEKKRWQKINKEIHNFSKKFKPLKFKNKEIKNSKKKYSYSVNYENNNLILNYKNIKLGFNLIKGLALSFFYDYSISKKKIICTIDQGFYYNQNLNVDFFTGHFIAETLNRKKITDISSRVLKPSIKLNKDNLIIEQKFLNTKVISSKKWVLNLRNKSLSLEYDFKNLNICETLRHSIITLNPDCFNKSNLMFATNNGGNKLESFKVDKNKIIDHAKRVSNIVSATCCQGMTEGKFTLGDENKRIDIQIDNSQNALIPMLQYYPDRSSYFLRLLFSSKEQDDTSINNEKNTIKTKINIKINKV